MPSLGPRLVIAAPSSGVGKTTVATGLMAALATRGVRVAAAKVGPDYIDPGYHALACGRPARNLDPWLSGADAMAPLAARAGAGADILVIEGVMGLFDGAGAGTEGSTAHLARLLDAPVVLVVDASAMSGSVAALVHGFASFDPHVRVAGVILNRLGSTGHEELLREALEPVGIPVLGALRRDHRITWRDRHHGLVPVAEEPDRIRAALRALAATVAGACDLDGLLALARAAPAVVTDAPPAATRLARARVAVAQGRAFSFYYPDNLEALEQAGAELVAFDPVDDPALPPGADALYVGGGFPEVYAEALAANAPLLADVRRQVDGGLPTWAECGGLLWLARRLDEHHLCGVLPTDARMSDRLSLGYRRARLRTATPVGPAGTRLRGHEFHYSEVDPAGDAVALEGRNGAGHAGFASPTLLASYLHVHLGADPAPAERFVVAAAAAGAAR